MKKNISILGSTGSIGTSTLDICRQHPDKFNVVALATGDQPELFLKQIEEFQPRLVSVSSEKDYEVIKSRTPKNVELLYGPNAAQEVAACDEADVVVSAIVGAAGLLPTLKAIEKGKTLALANKESMVIAGEIMSRKASEKGITILPVDSEHSAIFQSLNGDSVEDIENLVLTASGGPFLHTPATEFTQITKEQALKHPNWDMGAKITIDSASMMNKGLEVLEAHWLFNMPVEKIKVVIHPQSVIHSMVEYMDGSVISQMGEPDMRVPIAYALSYPRRISTNVKRLDLAQRGQLTFFAPDLQKFKCLAMAFEVAAKGKSYAPVLNAANEVAVDSFLKDRLSFYEISETVEDCLNAHKAFELKSLEDVLEADRWAREYTWSNVEGRKSKVAS